MIKILILCKKSETAKALINYVVSEVDILRVVGIANNNTEALNLIEQTKPNFYFVNKKTFQTLYTSSNITFEKYRRTTLLL